VSEQERSGGVPPLTHEEAEALISARLDTPLDPAQNRALLAHLATCRQCRAFATSMEVMARSLRELPQYPPSPVVSRQVRERIAAGRPWWSRWAAAADDGRWRGMPAVAGALVVLVFAATVLIFRGDEETGPRGPAAPSDTAIAQALTRTAEPTMTASESFAINAESPTPTRRAESAAEPSPTPTPWNIRYTPEPTPTGEVVIAGFTPTETVAIAEATEPSAPEPEASPSPTPTDEPTETPEPTETATEEPTETPEPTEPPEPTATSTEEPTETPTATKTPSPTATATASPTPTKEPTATEEPTATSAPTETPTPEPTETPRILPRQTTAPEDATESPEPVESPTGEEGDQVTPIEATEEATATPPIQPIGGGRGAAGTEQPDPADDGDSGSSDDRGSGEDEGDQDGNDGAEDGIEPGANPFESAEIVGNLPQNAAAAAGPLLRSPTGLIAVFSGENLVITDAVGSELRDLGPAQSPRWSPLGHNLLFAQNGRVYVWWDQDGSVTEVSAEGDGFDLPIGWHDAQLYYLRATPGQLAVWRTEWDGSDPVEIWVAEGIEPSGGEAVAVPGGLLIPTTAGWLHLSLDGSLKELGGPALPDGPVATSPSGNLLAFTSGGSLVISSVETPGEPLLTAPLATGSMAGWAFAPSEDAVVVTDGDHLFILGLDGVTLGQATAPSGWSLGIPSWDGDGITVAADDGSGGTMLYRLTPDMLSA